MGAEMTRNMRIESDTFDIDDFMHRTARYMGGEVHHTRNGAQSTEARIDADLAAADADAWDWNRLGRLAARFSRRAPVLDLLLGPLQVQTRQRKQVQRRLLDRDAEQVAPQQLQEEDIVQSENETARLVREIYRLLEGACGDDGINFFQFALNPDSFSDSVENMFYISFLVRDGKVAIYDDEHGDPRLMLSEEPTDEDREAGLTRRQIIIELDVDAWKSLVELYDVRRPMIPTRDMERPVSGVGAWYG